MNGVPVYHPDEIEEQIQKRGIEVVILTVPSKVAQEVTNRLATIGIKGILNFTTTRLTVPDTIRVHTIDLSVELQTLIYFIRNDENQSQMD